MIHFYTDYRSSNPDISRCQRLARETWAALNWTDVPVPDSALPRMFTGDGKSLPYLKDLFDIGIKDAEQDEICVFTNDDIQVHEKAPMILASVLQDTDAAYCYRRDFPPKLSAPVPCADYIKGHAYCGSDLYAFRASWWKKHRGEMPDMIIGYELHDAILRHLIEETNKGKPVAMNDLIAHEKNGNSWWEKPENRYTLKGQLYCLQLGVAWLAKRGIPASRHGVPYDFLRRGKKR